MEESAAEVLTGSIFGIIVLSVLAILFTFMTYQQFLEFKKKMNLRDLFWIMGFGFAALMFTGTTIHTAHEQFVVIPKMDIHVETMEVVDYYHERYVASGRRKHVAYNYYILNSKGEEYGIEKDFLEYLIDSGDSTFEVGYRKFVKEEDSSEKDNYKGYVHSIYTSEGS